MATAIAELPLSEANDIVAVVARDHSVVLFDQEKFDAWYDRLKNDAPKDVDITSKKDRDSLRSYAADVRGKKAEINRDRLKLTKEWRDLTSKVNEAGKAIDEQLEALADEVRRPLTQWEEAEKARVAECEAVITGIALAGTITVDDTADTVRQRGSEVWAIEIDADRFGPLFDQATDAKAHAVERLKTALARLTKEEEERAELEQLRAEKEARDAAEAAKREEEERVEGKRQYARAIIEHINQCGLGMIDGKVYPYIILIRELEDKIETGSRADASFGDMADDVEKARVKTLADIKEAQARQAEKAQRQAAENAAAAAREEESKKASEAQAARDREHAEALAAERRRAEEAERQAQAERGRIAAEENARAAEAKRLADEQAAREANKAHRTRVKTAAKQAIMTCGASEDAAQKIVLAIIAGEVPAVSLRF